MISPEENPPDEVSRGFAPYLAEASEVLASSLDYQATLTSLANLVVPDLADWCGIDMVQEDGSFTLLAVAHGDPEKAAWAGEPRRRYPPGPDASRGVPGVLRSGAAELYSEVTDEMLAAAARDAEHLRLMREVGFTSVMIVPLAARGRTLWAMTLVSAESGRRHESGNLALAEDLARCAALAVVNARLHREAQAEVSERKRAERELRDSEERFRSLTMNSSDMTTVFAFDGARLHAGPSMERVLGYGPETVIGGGFSGVVHPDDVSKLREELAERARTPGAGRPFEFRARHADGSWRVLESVGANRLEDPGVGGVVFNARDITERKRTEEELRRREAILRAVAFSVERLHRRTGTWEGGVREVLERLGEATEVSRVYVFENYTGDDGEVWATNTHEWAAPGASAQIDNPVPRALPYKDPAFSRFAEVFGRGRRCTAMCGISRRPSARSRRRKAPSPTCSCRSSPRVGGGGS